MKEEYTEPELIYIALADDVVRTSPAAGTDDSFGDNFAPGGSNLFKN